MGGKRTLEVAAAPRRVLHASGCECSLTVLDLVAALLLFLRPRVGIGLTVAIIISDVVHNLWFEATHPLSGSFFRAVTASLFMMSQIVFLLFVAITAPVAWPRTKEPKGAD